jgi:hypothetical protein
VRALRILSSNPNAPAAEGPNARREIHYLMKRATNQLLAATAVEGGGVECARARAAREYDHVSRRRVSGRLKPTSRNPLIGFGIGLSSLHDASRLPTTYCYFAEASREAVGYFMKIASPRRRERRRLPRRSDGQLRGLKRAVHPVRIEAALADASLIGEIDDP